MTAGLFALDQVQSMEMAERAQAQKTCLGQKFQSTSHSFVPDLREKNKGVFHYLVQFEQKMLKLFSVALRTNPNARKEHAREDDKTERGFTGMVRIWQEERFENRLVFPKEGEE